MSFATIIISGNITRDAEVVNFNNGKKGVKFGIAVNDSKEHTSFYDIVFTDDAAVNYLLERGTKGSSIAISGDVVINTKDGKNFINIYGRSVLELFSKKTDGNTANNTDTSDSDLPKPVSKPKKAKELPPPPAPTDVDVDDDDFPF